MVSFRGLIQTVSLGIFLVCLAGAVCGAVRWPDLFLRMDTGMALLTILASRTVLWTFMPAALVIVFTLGAGRIFCGYICPMGTTLDRMDAYAASPKTGKKPWTSVKYLILAVLAGAALLEISLVFTAAPLSLITRFYGLVIYPVTTLFSSDLLNLIRPAADHFDRVDLMFAQIKVPRFATQFFILGFFILLFGTAKISPRFWCRYLCPSGAVLAIFSIKPLIRRQVNTDCTQCGKCVRACPMNAIDPEEPGRTRYEECIACQTCQRVCPVQAVYFSMAAPDKTFLSADPLTTNGLPVSRRRFIHAGLAGAGTAALCLTGLNSVYENSGEGRVLPSGLIRPPGARPEMDFLARCVRCGECMASCPTNTLQPLWFTAGFTGIFSPALTPRRGYCDPRCTRCGEVCPTGAVQSLPPGERIWAKTGTAVIFRQKCLAWEFQKSCMVCDEVCPFDAIAFKKEPGNPFAVPHVMEDKCAGCGYCEYFCPVQNQSAIVVTPMGALRLSDSRFEKEGKSQGLKLSLRSKAKAYPSGEEASEGLAPGFDDGEETAPGFDDGK